MTITQHATANDNDWRMLTHPTREIRDAMFDLAVGYAAAFPDDVERIEGVRHFLHAAMADIPTIAPPPRRDLLFTIGVLIDVLGLDCRDPLTRFAVEVEAAELLHYHRTGLSARQPSSCPCCNEPAHPARAA